MLGRDFLEPDGASGTKPGTAKRVSTWRIESPMRINYLHLHIHIHLHFEKPCKRKLKCMCKKRALQTTSVQPQRR